MLFSGACWKKKKQIPPPKKKKNSPVDPPTAKIPTISPCLGANDWFYQSF